MTVYDDFEVCVRDLVKCAEREGSPVRSMKMAEGTVLVECRAGY